MKFETSEEYICSPKVKLTDRWKRVFKEHFDVFNCLLNYAPFEDDFSNIRRALCLELKIGRKMSASHLVQLRDMGFIEIDFLYQKVKVDTDFFLPEDFVI